MKVISFNDSSIQAYRLGKALLTYTNSFVGALMYTKGLVLRIEVQYNSFYILLLLYNSHKECSVLYLMHAHKNNLHNCVISRIQAHVDFQLGCK